MKKIAILGSGGFVGQSLNEYLKDKYEVYALSSRDLNLLDELKVKKFFKNHSIDVVFHCANQGGSRKTGYDNNKNDIIGNNLRMFFNIEKCITDHMKLIHFGSGAQYNKARDLVKIKEEKIGVHIPKDDYGFSKYTISKYINQAMDQKNIYNPIIFGLYGKFEDYTFKFISNSILKNLLKMPIIINQNVLFDYLFIDDFLRMMDYLIEKDYKNKEFNITPTKSIDLITIANIINECSDYKSDIIVKNKGLNYQYTGNNKKLLNNFGHKFEFTTYKQGISKLYAYYQDNLNQLDLETIRQDELLRYCMVKNS